MRTSFAPLTESGPLIACVQAMWYDSNQGKWRYLIEPGFGLGGGHLRADASQMPGMTLLRAPLHSVCQANPRPYPVNRDPEPDDVPGQGSDVAYAALC